MSCLIGRPHYSIAVDKLLSRNDLSVLFACISLFALASRLKSQTLPFEWLIICQWLHRGKINQLVNETKPLHHKTSFWRMQINFIDKSAVKSIEKLQGHNMFRVDICLCWKRHILSVLVYYSNELLKSF